MIRLATVFSGIGAIEHALQRMGIDHKLVFACDNGDIELFAKDVGMDIDGIENELVVLEHTIEKIQFDDEVEDLYKNQLAGMLREAVIELHEVIAQLKALPSSDNLVKRVLKKILDMPTLKSARKKEYSAFLKEIGKGCSNQARFRELQIIF